AFSDNDEAIARHRNVARAADRVRRALDDCRPGARIDECAASVDGSRAQKPTAMPLTIFLPRVTVMVPVYLPGRPPAVARQKLNVTTSVSVYAPTETSCSAKTRP